MGKYYIVRLNEQLICVTHPAVAYVTTQITREKLEVVDFGYGSLFSET